MIELNTNRTLKSLNGQSKEGLDKEALRQACQQFESLFLHQIMKGMRKTVVEGEILHGGNAEKIFMDMKDQAVSENMAESGGLGLAEILYSQLLEPEEGGLGRTNRTLESYRIRPREKEEPVSGREEFTLPVEGRLSSGYGMRVHPILNQEMMHHGIDLAAPEGTGIKAASAGRVSFSGWSKGYGNLVEVDHGQGIISRYGHNSENLVKVGDEVKAGQLLGRVGSTGRSTGPHLHFEIRKDGRAIDPYAMLDRGKATAHKDSAKTEVSG